MTYIVAKLLDRWMLRSTLCSVQLTVQYIVSTVHSVHCVYC